MWRECPWEACSRRIRSRLIKKWIDQGAEWPDNVGAQVEAAKTHWAFIPPKRPEIPQVRNAGWLKNPIDSFILARLEKEHLSPSPEADRVTLLRRLSLDLTGLPPTPAEVDAFRRRQESKRLREAGGPAAGSPHYGERWGRHWLDAARYADSDGYEKDKPRERLVLSRLGHQRAQPRPALRPVRHRADRRRPAAERHAGPDRRHRLPAQLDDQRRRRRRSRAVPHGSDVRPHGRHRQRRSSGSPSSARSATTTSTIR